MNYYLGVELKGGQIKIAAFKKNRQTFELVKLGSINLSIEAAEAVKEITGWISSNLPEPSSVKAVMTVSESSLYLKEVMFPDMPPQKLAEAIYWEIPSVAPIPQAEAVFDWQILSRDKGMINVLIAVGKSSYIQNIISTFKNAQIEVIAVEPSSYAFARAANATFETTTLICMAEERGTDYVILKNGIPFFSTSTTGHSQSDKVKNIKTGLDLTGDIVTEGKKIMSYWESKENLKIQQVIVAGDLVYKFRGLSHINLFPSIPSYVGTVKRQKSMKLGGYQDLELDSYLISIGAAVRHAKKSAGEGINLTTPEERKKIEKSQSQKKLTSQITFFVIANLFTVFVLVFTVFIFNLWWISIEKRILALDQTFAESSIGTLITQVDDVNATIDNTSKLLKSQIDSGARLKKISDLTPQTIRLTKISMVNAKFQEWTIEGVGDRDSILVYHEKLSREDGITEVKMPYSNFNDPGENEFSINIIW